MPVIARFYGMVIKMYFQQSEHNLPHIHVLYGEYMAAMEIQTFAMLEGDLPARALSLVREWMKLHQAALMRMWSTQEFEKLPPLD